MLVAIIKNNRFWSSVGAKYYAPLELVQPNGSFSTNIVAPQGLQSRDTQ